MNFFDWISTFPTYLQWAFLGITMLTVFFVIFKRNIEFGKFSMHKPKPKPKPRPIAVAKPKPKPVAKPKPKPTKVIGRKL